MTKRMSVRGLIKLANAFLDSDEGDDLVSESLRRSLALNKELMDDIDSKEEPTKVDIENKLDYDRYFESLLITYEYYTGKDWLKE